MSGKDVAELRRLTEELQHLGFSIDEIERIHNAYAERVVQRLGNLYYQGHLIGFRHLTST